MRSKPAGRVAALLTCAWLSSCSSERQPAHDSQDSTSSSGAPEAAGPAARAAVAAVLPSNATGCAPGSRCIAVSSNGRPATSGLSVAQCRGKFADFIVPKTTLPANYAGPWFEPELIENATTTGPTATRPWLNFNPTVAGDRLRYALALRNYAFTSRDLRKYTPQLTADVSYRDASAGGVAQSLRNQRWYPAQRMIYGNVGDFGTREAARGMTIERTVRTGELAGNTQPFRNYAVAYYDARGANAYRQVWSTTTPGKDVANTGAMKIPEGSFVYKLLFSAARAGDFPQDILQNSVAAQVLPNAGGVAVPVRLMQIDIAVKDSRAGPTGWYFATYAYDRSSTQSSPWRRMIPVGLMWGNDPNGPPIAQSWINPNGPAYARAHLGVDGRLNGPVDNPASACMSCHSTAQAPTYAKMLPERGCNVSPFRQNWFRNLSGGQAFGRFTDGTSSCTTTAPTPAPVAADYSLQLASTVSRGIGATATYNPCTWDPASPPSAAVAAVPAVSAAPVYQVTRDP